MRASVQPYTVSAAATWPAAGAEAETPAVTTAATVAVPLPSSLHTPAAASDAAREFEACCRALSHKANTALLEQLPLLQHGAVVDLGRNYIGAVGLQAIAVVLPHNPNFTELRAPRNGITNDAVIIFCRAMRGHPRLAVLDLSDNADISLVSGLALLSLAQQMPSLQKVRLDGTHVPEAVLNKLNRALERNAARGSQGVNAASPNAPAKRPMSTRLAVAAAPGTVSKAAAGSAEQAEAVLLSSLEARVCSAVKDGYQLPPAVPSTGWRVLEVPILAPPFLFDTEIDLLCRDVFPRLNDEFAAHRLILCPVVVVGGTTRTTTESDGTSLLSSALLPPRGGAEGRRLLAAAPQPPQPPQRTIGSYNRELHFSPVCDVTAAVVRGRFAAIELIGDRPGDYAQVSAAAMLDLQQGSHTAQQREERRESDDTSGTHQQRAGLEALQPILYEAHETAVRHAQWLLIATRRETRALQVPAAFAPLLTADPSIAHPDRHRSVVRDIVYDDALSTAAGATRPGVNAKAHTVAPSHTDNFAIARTLEWDYATEEHQWKRHQAWRRHVVATAPVAELVVAQYTAAFECTDAHGAVRFTKLEAFVAAMYNRLRTVVRACLRAKYHDGSSGENNDGAFTAVGTESGAAAGTTALSVQRLFRRIATQQLWNTAFLQSVSTLSSGATKKNVINRIILYAANPPSRNSLLVHSHDVTGLVMLMARAASRLQSLQHAYTLATYSSRSSVLLEEPDDVRSFVVRIVSQLTTDAAVLRYVHAEVDTDRLCAFFLQLLSGVVKGPTSRIPAGKTAASSGGCGALSGAAAALAAAGLPDYVARYTLGGLLTSAENADGVETGSAAGATSKPVPNGASPHAFVVLVDGIDQLQPPVRPCGALVYAKSSGNTTSSGAASGGAAGVAGNRAEPASWSDESAAATAASSQARSTANANNNLLDSLLPRAVARNVRLIASCASDSRAFAALRHLGRDSVETLSLGPVSANEVEQYLAPAVLSRLGLTFSEDDFECARGKKDAATGEYMRYLQDAARSAQEAPGFLTQSQVIQAFPDTTAEAAQGVYDRLVCAFGLPLTRNVLGFLSASRWGLTLPELRALLPQLSACRLQELLRVLRPALEPETPQEVSVMLGFGSGNAQLGSVRLQVRSFLDVAHREALQVVTDEQQIDNDQRVWHTQLAQYYLSVVYRCLSNSGRAANIGEGATAAAAAAAAAAVPSDERSTAARIRPEERRAMKEVLHHMTQSGAFWPQLDATVLSLPFLKRVYELGLGYAFLRDLTAAFNERYKRHLLGEDIGETSWQHAQPAGNGTAASAQAGTAAAGGVGDGARYALPAVLTRMRDYVRFAHDNGLLLSLRPTLTTQIALQIPAHDLNCVQRDAVTFLYRQLTVAPPTRTECESPAQQQRSSVPPPHALYFTTCTGTTATATGAAAVGGGGSRGAATHLGPVTCAAFLPNRKFIVTASTDRSLAWVNPQSGSVVWHARQPTAPVEMLTMCRTSAYVAAVSADRTVWIYDGLQGKLVAQCRGGEWFDAPISSVVFSARGRYVWVVTTDTRARCFECETGQLRCTLGVQELMGASAGGDDVEDGEEGSSAVAQLHRRRNYLSAVPDAQEDEVCATLVGHEVRRWRLQPWQACASIDVSAGVGGVEAPEKGKESLVAFSMTQRCRITPKEASSTAAAAALSGPAGYTMLRSWEVPAGLTENGTQSAVHVIGVPVECSTEVHLLVLFFPTESGDSTGDTPPAVRCVGAALDEGDEVTHLCASPDAVWLAVGMRSGRIGLFHLASAYRSWSAQRRRGSTDTIVCEPTQALTGLMPIPGTAAAPLRHLAFHRDSQLLFALGHSLKCWRVPTEATAAAVAQKDVTEVGEYVWTQTPTCLTVLPAAVAPSSDVELPSGVAELCVGDETGRLTLLRLWKPNY